MVFKLVKRYGWIVLLLLVILLFNNNGLFSQFVGFDEEHGITQVYASSDCRCYTWSSTPVETGRDFGLNVFPVSSSPACYGSHELAVASSLLYDNGYCVYQAQPPGQDAYKLSGMKVCVGSDLITATSCYGSVFGVSSSGGSDINVNTNTNVQNVRVADHNNDGVVSITEWITNIINTIFGWFS